MKTNIVKPSRKVSLLLGFDTEAPFDQPHQEEDIKPAIYQTITIVKSLNSLFDSYKVSRTFFLLGKFVEKAAKLYNKELIKIFNIDNPLIDVQSHAYSHRQFRHVPVGMNKPTLTPGQVFEDIKKANEIISEILHKEPIGLRAPRGYALGLNNSEELTESVKNAGMHYVSSDLRNKDWQIKTDLFDGHEIRQPRKYSNGLIEMPSHGWQDMAFSGLDIPGVPQFQKWDKKKVDKYIVGHYTELMDKAMDESKKRNKTIYIGGCFHPQAIAVYDGDLKLFRQILDIAKEKEVTVESYTSAFNNIQSLNKKYEQRISNMQ